ncbi:hypothetical protein KIN20_007371 [Parelaphostrongylus tenuis]|uniref:Secreted protein n=1 Tax=Parelaphostrongylus tenuis TaxID=148309 RepID=A0AAD5M5F1_PARTN|nr:hypothetical protein KIN20_007371 [Parelaphostrongylus tenuis]
MKIILWRSIIWCTSSPLSSSTAVLDFELVIALKRVFVNFIVPLTGTSIDAISGIFETTDINCSFN